MNKNELGKLVIISGAAGGSRRLHLSGRQIKQLKKQFREQGKGSYPRERALYDRRKKPRLNDLSSS